MLLAKISNSYFEVAGFYPSIALMGTYIVHGFIANLFDCNVLIVLINLVIT